MKQNVLNSGLLVVATLGLMAGAAPAQEFRHVERLARQMERRARILHEEADRHFPRATALHHHAADLERLARHLHELAHGRGNRRHMRADFRKMDALIHHMADDLRGLRALNVEGMRALGHMREALRDLHESVTRLRRHLYE